MPSSLASSMTTSVLLGWPPVWASRSSCRVTKLRLAAARKPSVSKPDGMPHDCEPPRAEPIMLPPASAAEPCWADAALVSKAAPWRSHGRAEASLPTLLGLYCEGAVAVAGPPAHRHARVAATPSRA